MPRALYVPKLNPCSAAPSDSRGLGMSGSWAFRISADRVPSAISVHRTYFCRLPASRLSRFPSYG